MTVTRGRGARKITAKVSERASVSVKKREKKANDKISKVRGRGRKPKRGKRGESVVKIKRTKERTIADIIEKVKTWRKLYNGVATLDDDGEHNQGLHSQKLIGQRWSLEEAATQVGVSKKSLDDYLLQLRFGKKFGFDFEANKNEKVGVLRYFVKQQKDIIKQGRKGIKISSKCDGDGENGE